MKKSEQSDFNESLEFIAVKAAYMNLVAQVIASSDEGADRILDDAEKNML